MEQLNLKYCELCHHWHTGKDQGRVTAAEALHKQALAIRQKTLPKDHIDIAINLNNLATLYESQGRYAEAELLYIEALEIFRRGVGSEHPNVRIVATNLHRLRQALQ